MFGLVLGGREVVVVDLIEVRERGLLLRSLRKWRIIRGRNWVGRERLKGRS